MSKIRFNYILITIFYLILQKKSIKVKNTQKSLKTNNEVDKIFNTLIKNLDNLEFQIEDLEKKYKSNHIIDKKCINYYNYWILKNKNLKINENTENEKLNQLSKIEIDQPIKFFKKKVKKNKLFAKWFDKNIKNVLKDTSYAKKIDFDRIYTIPSLSDNDYVLDDLEDYHFKSLPPKISGLSEKFSIRKKRKRK